jgi:hypothetical protein
MSVDTKLAYVFWHVRQPQVTREAYEQAHLAFQRTLQANSPAGSRGARVLRLSGAPWMPSSPQAPEVYEDWYFLDDSAALDRINEAAVSGVRRAPHDGVARLAAAGIAGLYRLQNGIRNAKAQQALWFSKPAGMSYPALAERFATRGADEALWMRQMTLGPTPEFCLQTNARLPEGFMAQASLTIEATWEFPQESQ